VLLDLHDDGTVRQPVVAAHFLLRHAHHDFDFAFQGG
jgi:hypothetical protein